MEEYIDARYSYFGVNTAAKVAAKVLDFDDSGNTRKGKIVWRAFLGSAGGQVADPWPLSSMVVGTVTGTLDGSSNPVHVIGPLVIQTPVIVAPGSSVLVDGGVFIRVTSAVGR